MPSPRLQSHLPVFMEVAEQGSFSAAARKLSVSPATVSKSIRELENRLGIRLFHRSTHSVHMTDEGETLFSRIAQSMGEINEALNHIGERRSSPVGKLKVSLMVTFGHRLILPVILEYLESHPDVQMDLRFEDRYVDLIGEGFDIGIGVQPELGSQTVARKLYDIEMVTVASPAYLERYGTPQIPEELRGHECIITRMLSNGRPNLWRFRTGQREIVIEPQGKLTVSSYRAKRQAALAGFGIGHIGRFQVRDDIASGTLVPILEGYNPPPDTVRVFYPCRYQLPHKTRAFIDFLFDRFHVPGDEVRERST